MSLFVDTSALYATLSASDGNHERAAAMWKRISQSREQLVTSNYVLVESMALLGRRLGLQAVRDFQSEFVPVLQLVWVEKTLHQRAVAALLTANTRDLSLVDCISFEIMRDLSLETAFAFDTHFVQQGFICVE